MYKELVEELRKPDIYNRYSEIQLKAAEAIEKLTIELKLAKARKICWLNPRKYCAVWVRNTRLRAELEKVKQERKD